MTVRLRLFVHPLEGHGTTQVSGISRELSGPELESRSRMSRRKAVVVAEPCPGSLVARPVGGAREVEAEIADRAHHRIELEQRAVLLEGVFELVGSVRGAEATPGDEVGARRDGRGRVDLQQGQPLHDCDELGWARRVEQLRAHRDPPRLRLREPMHRPEA